MLMIFIYYFFMFLIDLGNVFIFDFVNLVLFNIGRKIVMWLNFLCLLEYLLILLFLVLIKIEFLIMINIVVKFYMVIRY